MYKDLRGWLRAAEDHGEVKHISGANWDLEVGSIAEIVYRGVKEPKPALLFDDITGYPKGYRTLFGQMSSPWRLAMTLGLPEDELERMKLAQNWGKKNKEIRSIPPEFVKSSLVMENVDIGEQVDLFKFPSPKFHELDRQRYIGTACLVIMRDPDDNWVNLGTYRIPVVDRNTLALHITEGKNGNIIMRQKYFARGQVMPVAIAIGTSPTLYRTGGLKLPWGTSEYDYAGALMGEPIEVIKGKYTGLPIPAHAEIVIEGECNPGDLVDEGPFGEARGYYANLGLTPVPEPAIRVKAVYYRNEPIITCEQPAIPPHTYTLVNAVYVSAAIQETLEAIGISGIKGVWCHESGAGSLFNVISIEQQYVGHSREVGLIASQIPRWGRYTVVVDEDIDPSDLNQVIWAITTRTTPDRSIQILDHCRSGSNDPAIPLAEKKKYKTPPKPLYSSRIVIDACWDLAHKGEWYPTVRVAPKLQTEILKKWQSTLSDII